MFMENFVSITFGLSGSRNLGLKEALILSLRPEIFSSLVGKKNFPVKMCMNAFGAFHFYLDQFQKKSERQNFNSLFFKLSPFFPKETVDDAKDLSLSLSLSHTHTHVDT